MCVLTRTTPHAVTDFSLPFETQAYHQNCYQDKFGKRCCRCTQVRSANFATVRLRERLELVLTAVLRLSLCTDPERKGGQGARQPVPPSVLRVLPVQLVSLRYVLAMRAVVVPSSRLKFVSLLCIAQRASSSTTAKQCVRNASTVRSPSKTLLRSTFRANGQHALWRGDDD